GRRHAKALDLESSDGHFYVSSGHQGPVLESTRLNLHWGDGIGGGGGATMSTSSVPRCSRSCPPHGNPVVRTRLSMNRQCRIKVSSAGIAGSGRETRCDTGR